MESENETIVMIVIILICTAVLIMTYMKSCMVRRDQFHTPFQIEVVSDTCCIPLPPSSPNNLSVCVLMSRCVCACMSICVCAYSLVPGPDPSLCGGLGTRLTMMWCERIMSNYYNISVILTNGHHLGQYI